MLRVGGWLGGVGWAGGGGEEGAVERARRLGDLGDAGERAVDAVDQQRQAEPGEAGGKIVVYRRIKRQQRHRRAGAGEQMDGEPRRPSDPLGFTAALVAHPASDETP